MSQIEVHSVGDKVIIGAAALDPDDALDLADRIADEAAVTGAKFAGMGPDDEGGWTVNVQPSAGLQRRMVAFLCEWLGPAENYTETGVGLPFDLPGGADSMSYSPKPAGQVRPYVLTVQRDTGKSPHEKRMGAEAERDALQRKLDAHRRWLREQVEKDPAGRDWDDPLFISDLDEQRTVNARAVAFGDALRALDGVETNGGGTDG